MGTPMDLFLAATFNLTLKTDFILIFSGVLLFRRRSERVHLSSRGKRPSRSWTRPTLFPAKRKRRRLLQGFENRRSSAGSGKPSSDQIFVNVMVYITTPPL